VSTVFLGRVVNNLLHGNKSLRFFYLFMPCAGGVRVSLRFVLLSEAKNPRLYGNKGCSFANSLNVPAGYGDGNERLRLSDLIKSAVRGALGRGTQAVPLPRGSPARWHKPQLARTVKTDSSPHGFARTVFGQPKHAKKSLRDVFRFAPRTAADISRSAVETRRYGLGAELFRDLF
jgi:hypothetical protein